MSLRRGKDTGKEVYLFYPESLRLDEMIVEQEVELGLTCREHEGVVYRYQKEAPGWSSKKRTLWLAVSGIPLTAYLKAGEMVESRLEDFLRWVWSDSVYEHLPDELREPIESTAYGATVTVEPVKLTEEQEKSLSSVTAYQILRQHIINIFKDFAAAEPTKDAGEIWMNRILWLVAGAFIMYFGLKQGII